MYHLKLQTAKRLYSGNYFLSGIALLFLFVSCAPQVTTSLISTHAPLDYKEEIMIYGLHEEAPEVSEEIGEVVIGDTGFTSNCDFTTVMDLASLETRKAGGNAFKIVEHRPPDFASTCHRLRAKILIIKKEKLMTQEINQGSEDFYNADFATLHIYRLKGPGSILNYDLYLNDSVICRVKNNWGETILLRKEGEFNLWAKTETTEEMPIYLERGKEYYIQCGVKMGILVGRPELMLIDPNTGKYAFDSIILNKK